MAVRYYLNIFLPLKIPRALYGLSFFMPEQHRKAAGSLGMRVLMRWAQITIMEAHKASASGQTPVCSTAQVFGASLGTSQWKRQSLNRLWPNPLTPKHVSKWLGALTTPDPGILVLVSEFTMASSRTNAFAYCLWLLLSSNWSRMSPMATIQSTHAENSYNLLLAVEPCQPTLHVQHGVTRDHRVFHIYLTTSRIFLIEY